MKEDKFITAVLKGTGYAKENTQGVLLVVVALVVIIAGIVIWRSHIANKQENAQSKLGIAQIAYQDGQFLEAKDSLLSLVNGYGKTESAHVGMFLLGHLYYAIGIRDSAGIFWNDFLKTGFEDKDLQAAAKAGLAAIQSDNGNYMNAAETYKDLYSEYPDYFNRGDWIFKAAENYLAAGEKGKAREFFQKFIDEYGENPRVQNAKIIVAELNAQ